MRELLIDFIFLVFSYPFIASLMSFILGLFIMPQILYFARKHNFTVLPNKRTSHIGAIPNIGGINIYLSFLFCYILVLRGHFVYFLPHSDVFIIGLSLITMVGFIDDVIVLTPKQKSFGELIAGILLVFVAKVRINSLFGLFSVETLSEPVSILISLFVFFAIVNAINLIDGVDGLASGLGILYCLFFGYYFYLVSHPVLSVLSFILLGSLVTFFLYNVFGRSESKIFMGDSGSLLLGYMVTFLLFNFFESNINNVGTDMYMNAAPAVALCVLFVPIFDTIRVMLTRMRKGKSPFEPDRNHIHHLLLSLGLKHRNVTFVLLTVALFFTLLGVIGRNWGIWVLTITAVVVGIVLTYILWRLVDRKNIK